MQKKLLSAGLACFISLLCTAQECANYYFLQNNKTVEMTIFNKKGEPNGKQVYSVSNISNMGGVTRGTVNSEMMDKKGKTVARGKSDIECTGGIMMIDLKMMLPQQQQEQFNKTDAKLDRVFIEYPNNMKPGDQLKDAELHITMDNNGMKQELNMTVNNRKVEGQESITTAAGTWDCFKISYKSKLNVRTMGVGIPINIDGTEWYAPGFGVVKTESKHGSTEITSIK